MREETREHTSALKRGIYTNDVSLFRIAAKNLSSLFLIFLVSSTAMGMSTSGFFMLAAFFEIAGCFAFWSWLRLGRTPWWTVAGVVSLVLFAACLTRVDSPYAGRAFAAYGGVYIANSLLWLRIVEGIWPDKWDMTGALICLLGASVILWGPRA